MIDKNFDKGCVFIVGGSGGIGSICAKEFAKAGANVVITYYKNKKAAEDVASEINKNILIFQLDNKDCFTKPVFSFLLNISKPLTYVFP